MAERTSKPYNVTKDDIRTGRKLLTTTQKMYLQYHSQFVGTLTVSMDDFDREKAALYVFIVTFILLLVIARLYKIKLKDIFNPFKIKENFKHLKDKNMFVAILYVISYLAMVGSATTLIKYKLNIVNKD